MRFWSKSVRIFNAIRAHGTQSMRPLARHTGLSNSSVHRHPQAMALRDQHPESWWWETPEGRNWLIRRVGAVWFLFGLKRGVGADTLSEFCARLPLETPIGGAPSALRSVMDTWERILLETAAAWEQQGMAHGARRPSIGAVDATCLPRMRRVCMDLARGSLWVEAGAVDRPDDTWHGVVKARRKPWGVAGSSLVRDRAKALRKLAATGLDGLRIPDVLHRSHDRAKSYSLAIFSRLRHAPQAWHQAQEPLATCQASHPGGAEAQQAPACGETNEAEGPRWQGVRSASRSHRGHLSLRRHPWRLVDAIRQTAHEVARQLHAAIAALATLIETHGLPVKQHTVDTVRTQLAGVSALVDLWWQTGWHDGEPMALTPRWKPWGDAWLLPLLDWQEPRSRTRCPGPRAKMALALKTMPDAFARHPCTQRRAPDVRADWQAWAAAHATACQRVSSAVEGRNGSVAQRQQHQRGLPKRRSQVWTVWYHCDCRASDGTTPASRFFRRAFPALFESVLSHIDDLPQPRQRHQVLTISH
jgi:Family of unknown function (DUF6399)